MGRRRLTESQLAREAEAIAQWNEQLLYIRPLNKGGKRIELSEPWPDAAPKKQSWHKMRTKKRIPGLSNNLLESHPHFKPPVVIPNPGRLQGNAPPVVKDDIAPRGPITTIGWLPDEVPAYVYVGAKRDGRLKVGMSIEPENRCRNLGLTMILAHPVMTDAAKAVETDALRRLGARAGDGEYVWCEVQQAVDAVKAARDAIGKRFHADPSLTAEEARLQRIANYK